MHLKMSTSEIQECSMAKNFDEMEDNNRSSNRTIHEVSDPSRRVLLRGAAASAFLAPLAVGSAGALLAGCAPVPTGETPVPLHPCRRPPIERARTPGAPAPIKNKRTPLLTH